jgi:hypothetical protein
LEKFKKKKNRKSTGNDWNNWNDWKCFSHLARPPCSARRPQLLDELGQPVAMTNEATGTRHPAALLTEQLALLRTRRTPPASAKRLALQPTRPQELALLRPFFVSGRVME